MFFFCVDTKTGYCSWNKYFIFLQILGNMFLKNRYFNKLGCCVN